MFQRIKSKNNESCIRHRSFLLLFHLLFISRRFPNPSCRTIYQEERRRDNSLFIHGDQPQISGTASSRNYARGQRFNEPVPCGPAPDFSGFVKSHVNARFIVHRPPFFPEDLTRVNGDLLLTIQQPTSSMIVYPKKRSPSNSRRNKFLMNK